MAYRRVFVVLSLKVARQLVGPERLLPLVSLDSLLDSSSLCRGRPRGLAYWLAVAGLLATPPSKPQSVSPHHPARRLEGPSELGILTSICSYLNSLILIGGEEKTPVGMRTIAAVPLPETCIHVAAVKVCLTPLIHVPVLVYSVHLTDVFSPANHGLSAISRQIQHLPEIDACKTLPSRPGPAATASASSRREIKRLQLQLNDSRHEARRVLVMMMASV